MKRSYDIDPDPLGGWLVVRDRARRQASCRHRQALQDQVARQAEQAARAATAELLGEAKAHWSVWVGRRDGTAAGSADGLEFEWVPWTPSGASLVLLRRCGTCWSPWWVPVRTEGQLIGALVEDRCGCRRSAAATARRAGETA